VDNKTKKDLIVFTLILVAIILFATSCIYFTIQRAQKRNLSGYIQSITSPKSNGSKNKITYTFDSDLLQTAKAIKLGLRNE